MGNSTSADKQNVAAPKSNFDPEYEVLNPKVALPHYGDVKIVRDVKTGQTMILKEVVVNTKQAFESELDFYNKRATLGHPNVVNILGYSSVDKHNFCSTYFKISIFIEVLERNLHNELEARRVHGNRYTENELLHITDNLVSGLAYFQAQGFSHGDIRPVNIFANNNVYKLSDPSLSAQKGSNGLTAAILSGAHSLLSPQLIEQVPSSQFEIKCDPYKADVFSLGATLLSVATLTNSEELYDYQAGTINKQLIQERLETVRGSYSGFTHDLIRSMVTIEESERPDSVALAQQLHPYQTEIRAGAQLPFVTSNVSSHHGESHKRSALPQDDNTHGLSQTDDLEARIQAALLRTQETFKAVAARDSAYNNGQTDYYSASYTTTSHATPATHHGEHQLRSALPQETAQATIQESSYVPETYISGVNQTNYGTTNYNGVTPSYDYGNNIPTSYLTSNAANYGTTTYEGSYGVEGTLKSSGVHQEGERPLRSAAANYEPATIDTNALRSSYADFNAPKSPLKSYLLPENQQFYSTNYQSGSGVYGTGSGLAGSGVQTGNYTGTYTTGNQAISGLENLAKSYHMDQNTVSPATYTTSTYTTSYVTGGNVPSTYGTQGYTSNYATYTGSHDTGAQGLTHSGAVESGAHGVTQAGLEHSGVAAGEGHVQGQARSHTNLDQINAEGNVAGHVENNNQRLNNSGHNQGAHVAVESNANTQADGSASLKKSITEKRGDGNEGHVEHQQQHQVKANSRPASTNEITGN